MNNCKMCNNFFIALTVFHHTSCIIVINSRILHIRIWCVNICFCCWLRKSLSEFRFVFVLRLRARKSNHFLIEHKHLKLRTARASFALEVTEGSGEAVQQLVVDLSSSRDLCCSSLVNERSAKVVQCGKLVRKLWNFESLEEEGSD